MDGPPMLRPCARPPDPLFSLIISGRSCRILRVQVPPVYPSVYLDLYRYRSFIGVDIYSRSILTSILGRPLPPHHRSSCARPLRALLLLAIARRSPVSLVPDGIDRLSSPRRAYRTRTITGSVHDGIIRCGNALHDFSFEYSVFIPTFS